MDCDKVREQFTDHLIGGAGEPVPLEVAEHLATCESCRLETDQLRSVWGTLGAFPAGKPEAGARARFDLMVSAYQQGLDNSISNRPASPAPEVPDNPRLAFGAWLAGWWQRQPALQFGLGIALLLVGVAIGSFVYRPQVPAVVQSNDEIAELRGELSAMKQIVALSLMQQQSASDRLRGVNWSYELGQPGQEVLNALLDTLMRDPNVNVRLATVDALRQFGDRPVVRKGVVEALGRQESPMVQVALIDLAVDLKDVESIDTLRRLTQDEAADSSVRERAQKGLAQLQ